MKRFLLILVALLILASVNVLTWFMMGGIRVVKHNEHVVWVPQSDDDVIDRMPTDIQREILSGSLTGMAAPSLEMRENVDFLLTPGILVQQCISEDVLITYPEE